MNNPVSGNLLPPHVIEARLAAQSTRHKDGRSWLCSTCGKIVDAKWSHQFEMWLPISSYWIGAPNVIEKAFCSAHCSAIWHEAFKEQNREKEDQRRK